MSTNGLAVVTQARRILRDPDTGRPVFSNDELRQSVNRQVMLVAKELGLGTAWVTSCATLAPGTTDYTLTGTDEYEQIIQVRYASDLVELPIRSLAEVLALREGGVASGRPSICALRLNTSRGVVLLTDTDPVAGETLDALVSTVPASWDVDDATPPTIPFSQAASLALELRVANSVARVSGAEKLNAVALTRETVDGWAAEAAELIRQERLTIIRLKRSRGPMNASGFAAWARG